MRTLAVSLFCLLVFSNTGCLVAPVVPPVALVYSNIKAPLDVDVNETVLGSLRGEASATMILGLFSFGDAGLYAAAQNGRLETIDSADYEFVNVLGIYQRFTTIVYGR